jgi:dipeptidase E
VPNPIEVVEKAQGIFIGGGNTFLLLKTLQEKNLIEPIRRQVLEKVKFIQKLHSL